MAKIRNIYFQDDVIEALVGEKNISGLINNLLREHIRKTKFEGLTKEQALLELKKLDLQEEFNRKLKELENAK